MGYSDYQKLFSTIARDFCSNQLSLKELQSKFRVIFCLRNRVLHIKCLIMQTLFIKRRERLDLLEFGSRASCAAMAIMLCDNIRKLHSHIERPFDKFGNNVYGPWQLEIDGKGKQNHLSTYYIA